MPHAEQKAGAISWLGVSRTDRRATRAQLLALTGKPEAVSIIWDILVELDMARCMDDALFQHIIRNYNTYPITILRFFNDQRFELNKAIVMWLSDIIKSAKENGNHHLEYQIHQSLKVLARPEGFKRTDKKVDFVRTDNVVDIINRLAVQHCDIYREHANNILFQVEQSLDILTKHGLARPSMRLANRICHALTTALSNGHPHCNIPHILNWLSLFNCLNHENFDLVMLAYETNDEDLINNVKSISYVLRTIEETYSVAQDAYDAVPEQVPPLEEFLVMLPPKKAEEEFDRARLSIECKIAEAYNDKTATAHAELMNREQTQLLECFRPFLFTDAYYLKQQLQELEETGVNTSTNEGRAKLRRVFTEVMHLTREVQAKSAASAQKQHTIAAPAASILQTVSPPQQKTHLADQKASPRQSAREKLPAPPAAKTQQAVSPPQQKTHLADQKASPQQSAREKLSAAPAANTQQAISPPQGTHGAILAASPAQLAQKKLSAASATQQAVSPPQQRTNLANQAKSPQQSAREQFSAATAANTQQAGSPTQRTHGATLAPSPKQSALDKLSATSAANTQQAVSPTQRTRLANQEQSAYTQLSATNSPRVGRACYIVRGSAEQQMLRLQSAERAADALTSSTGTRTSTSTSSRRATAPTSGYAIATTTSKRATAPGSMTFVSGTLYQQPTAGTPLDHFSNFVTAHRVVVR